MRVLIPTEYYLPGFKAGGPIRCVSNLIARLGDEIDFRVITRDRDQGDSEPYPGVTPGRWQWVGKAEVLYLSPHDLARPTLRRHLRGHNHDILYLNSLFSRHFTIRPLLLRRLGLVPESRVVLAPRGELSPGAMSLKPGRKRVYLALAKRLGLFRDVTWHATSAHEADNIVSWIGGTGASTALRSPVVRAPDPTTPANENEEGPPRPRKDVGSLKIVAVSRVTRMKNLETALTLLKDLTGDVRFDIYGPIESARYWSRCEEVIATLPPNVRVNHCGTVPPDQVVSTMAAYDLFLLPTHGENFGHVIHEALTAGLPVLISDRTPWRGLEEKGVGWDLPLERPEAFREVLQRCVAMDEATRQAFSLRAWEYAARPLVGSYGEVYMNLFSPNPTTSAGTNDQAGPVLAKEQPLTG
jgi:glycosyltransferase involved in cell wall biosynthesis